MLMSPFVSLIEIGIFCCARSIGHGRIELFFSVIVRVEEQREVGSNCLQIVAFAGRALNLAAPGSAFWVVTTTLLLPGRDRSIAKI